LLISEGAEKMKEYVFAVALVLFVCASSAGAAPKKGTMKDSRDGRVYKTAVLGGRTWMMENLNAEVKGSYCYENLNKNCKRYGRLYTWKAALSACPKGWRLPDREEFAELADWLAQNPSVAFDTLRGGERVCFNGKNVWNDYCESATSIGVPGGTAIQFDYSELGEKSYFWTGSEAMAYNAYFYVYDEDSKKYVENIFKENFAYSVRCIKN
jgi:uncharacterized protein (TIGR02145 family)